MRYLLTTFSIALLFACSAPKTPTSSVSELTTESTSETKVAEVACGQCKFGLEGAGCHLAVRIDGEAHYTEGYDQALLGNPHGENGICESIRKANVEGEVVDGKFQVKTLEVIPEK